MKSQLKIYNTLAREKQVFEPLVPGHVGFYVCGPTVYSDVHLGNCRTFICFDVVHRYLVKLGYKVRYVRNITDVGHLVDDQDDGEDKIAKKAKVMELEPMEVVQHYTNGFHEMMEIFNCNKPNIEPSATGHIIEQIEMVQQILDKGFAYESNGSVYFDVKKFSESYPYGELSGRVLDDLRSGTRELDGQSEKRDSLDFAIWKAASDEHIMRWNSPWGEGFPGWHLECSVMSQKYLGETFDIHGGGMDLKFPHHECEIAQSVASYGTSPVRYWMHTNMVTVNGEKMGKSNGNSIMPAELFSGDHPLLTKGYSPMALRFFILQSHYSSNFDISNDALQASEKGYQRLMNSYKVLHELEYASNGSGIDAAEEKEIQDLCEKCYDRMNDDFNTAETIAVLFDMSKKINSFKEKHIPISSISEDTFQLLKATFTEFVRDVLGLKEETTGDNGLTDELIGFILEMRNASRERKDWATSDQIRDKLTELKIQVKDGKEGVSWTVG